MEEMKKAVATRVWSDTLKQLVKDVRSKTFSGKKWCINHGVNTYFIQAAVELDVIYPVGKAGVRVIYDTNFNLSNAGDVRTLEDLSKRISDTIKNVYKNREKKPVTLTKVNPTKPKKAPIDVQKKEEILPVEKPEKTIRDFTIEEIVTELRLRGYEYSITKMEEYTFKAK